jgi:hypothetical protein
MIFGAIACLAASLSALALLDRNAITPDSQTRH